MWRIYLLDPGKANSESKDNTYIVREERISFMVMQKWVFSKTRLLRAHAFSNHPQERVAGVEGWAGAQGGARRRKVQVLWWLVISGGSYQWYIIINHPTDYNESCSDHPTNFILSNIIKIIHCGSCSDHPTMIHEWSWLFSSMICWFSWAIRIRDGNAYEKTMEMFSWVLGTA